MHAAVVSDYSKSPQYAEFPEPTALEDEVLVRVRAAGLHPIVKGLASGSHYASGGQLPMVPGIDGVGTLEDGSRVYFGFARKPWGTLCERTVAPRIRCLPLPDGIDDLQAAAIANPGMSAWLSLSDRAALKPGETVLVQGATGVAGHLAIQLARSLGAGRVIGAGRNIATLEAENLDAVIALGQPENDIRAAYIAEAERGIDVVIDYLWGRPAELLLEALAATFKPAGGCSTRWVEVGASAGNSINLPAATLRSVDLKLLGSGFGAVSLERVIGAIPELFERAASGALRVNVEPVPLAQIESAWSRVEKGSRIVFVP